MITFKYYNVSCLMWSVWGRDKLIKTREWTVMNWDLVSPYWVSLAQFDNFNQMTTAMTLSSYLCNVFLISLSLKAFSVNVKPIIPSSYTIVLTIQIDYFLRQISWRRLVWSQLMISAAYCDCISFAKHTSRLLYKTPLFVNVFPNP